VEESEADSTTERDSYLEVWEIVSTGGQTSENR